MAFFSLLISESCFWLIASISAFLFSSVAIRFLYSASYLHKHSLTDCYFRARLLVSYNLTALLAISCSICSISNWHFPVLQSTYCTYRGSTSQSRFLLLSPVDVVAREDPGAVTVRTVHTAIRSCAVWKGTYPEIVEIFGLKLEPVDDFIMIGAIDLATVTLPQLWHVWIIKYNIWMRSFVVVTAIELLGRERVDEVELATIDFWRSVLYFSCYFQLRELGHGGWSLFLAFLAVSFPFLDCCVFLHFFLTRYCLRFLSTFLRRIYLLAHCILLIPCSLITLPILHLSNLLLEKVDIEQFFAKFLVVVLLDEVKILLPCSFQHLLVDSHQLSFVSSTE